MNADDYYYSGQYAEECAEAEQQEIAKEKDRIKSLVVARRKECGMGLCGSYEAIARWLFEEHGIIATTEWIADAIRAALQESSHD